jgi:hypothetical protein
MPDTTVPLNDLSQQIAQHESQLKRLREDYEARRARLAELAQQRESLQAQLRQVNADIQAVRRGQPLPAAPAAEAAPATSPKPAARGALTDVLIEVVREANRPQTARLLAEELVRRRFPTTSGNITNLVQNRLSELVKRGVFRRAKGQPGVIMGQQTNGAVPAKKAPAAKAAARKTAPAKAPSQPGQRKGQPSLRSLLTEILQKGRKPVAARDLAEQVLATGYKTKSKDFIDVVWTALGQLEGVENVKGQGWRLKKG